MTTEDIYNPIMRLDEMKEDLQDLRRRIDKIELELEENDL